MYVLGANGLYIFRLSGSYFVQKYRSRAYAYIFQILLLSPIILVIEGIFGNLS